ncbi:MAG: hypothetical protein ACTSYI_13955 [Promethearchaeota archaeon]
MPKSNRLNSEIEGVFEFFDQFLNHINRKETFYTREECTSVKYHAILSKERPWLITLLKPESPTGGKSDGVSQSAGKKQNIHTAYIKQIERNPAEKTSLIKEFLEYFPEISLADRVVLAENFKGLTYKELYTEFENLTQIFNRN